MQRAREDCSFIWDNYYYEEERINEYELNLFIREDAESEQMISIADIQETHFQRGIYVRRDHKDRGRIRTAVCDCI